MYLKKYRSTEDDNKLDYKKTRYLLNCCENSKINNDILKEEIIAHISWICPFIKRKEHFWLEPRVFGRISIKCAKLPFLDENKRKEIKNIKTSRKELFGMPTQLVLNAKKYLLKNNFMEEHYYFDQKKFGYYNKTAKNSRVLKRVPRRKSKQIDTNGAAVFRKFSIFFKNHTVYVVKKSKELFRFDETRNCLMLEQQGFEF